MTYTYLYGAGGLSREIYSLLLDMQSELTEKVCFVVDSTYLESASTLNDFPICPIEKIPVNETNFLILALGDIAARNAFVERMSHGGSLWPTLIHPTASVGFDSVIGTGCVILAGVTITASCRVGDFTLINPNTSISHDCVIGNFVSIGPGVNLAGRVRVGDCVDIGTGAIVLPGIQIGSNAVIGAGAVVTKDVQPGDTVVGNPAKVI